MCSWDVAVILIQNPIVSGWKVNEFVKHCFQFYMIKVPINNHDRLWIDVHLPADEEVLLLQC